MPAPTETPRLYSTMDSAEAILGPAIGPPGSVAGVTFVSSQAGRGARLVRADKQIHFPLTVIDLASGRLEFDYYPAYTGGQPGHRVLFAVGGLESRMPVFACEVDTTLHFYVDDGGGNSIRGVRSAPGVRLWTANTRQRIRLEWDRANETDSLRIFLNGVRVDVSPRLPGGWRIAPLATDSVWFGCLNGNNDAWCEGVIDELRSTSVAPAVVVVPPPPPRANALNPIGTNLEILRYWTKPWMFIDKFKNSGVVIGAGPAGLVGWASATTAVWNDGRPVDIDADGWVRSLLPDQHAVTLFPSHEGGRFVVLYDGSGTLTLPNTTVVSSAAGRIVVDLPVNAQCQLHITTVTAGNHPRNIRLVPVAHEATYAAKPFHPLFLDRMSAFSLLRTKDLSSTDTNTLVTEWADRTQPAHRDQGTDRGVAWEHIIDLCNALRQDAWICVPHLASDDYMLQLAKLVQARLAPDLKIYVEWSNEVWNGVYPVAAYARAQGASLNSNPAIASRRFQSRRSVQMFKIFESVVPAARLVRVIADQVGAAFYHNELLDFENAIAHVDAFAIAPYFGLPYGDPQAEANALANGLPWLLDHLQNTSMPDIIARARQSYTPIHAHNIPMIAYEGGQALVATDRNNAALVNLMADANRSPRMYDIYQAFLAQWRAIGGHEFANFSFCGAYGYLGSFAMLERQDQDLASAPKMRAVLDYGTANPRWWL